MGRVKNTFKYGCFGCLGTAAAMILVIGAMAGLAAWQSGRPKAVEQRELTQDLPVAPADAYRGERDTLPRIELSGDDVPSGAGRVVLRMKIGSFRVVPGPPGTPVRVDADYDTNRFKLDQSYESQDDGTWDYTLKFGPKSFLSMFAMGGMDEPRVTVTLPRDVPMVIDADIRMGESEVELGGLYVLDARFDIGMGDHRVSFSEPLPVPMAGLVVDGGMGALALNHVGNASPGRVDVRQSMGELRLDLRGRWVQDSSIVARCSMGECGLRAPTDVGIEIAGTRITLGEKVVRIEDRPRPTPEAPSLKIDVAQTMGELRLE